MRQLLIPILAALLVCGPALTPALPDVHQIGAVNVAADHYTHVSWSRFDGPVMRLRFVATNDTIDCEHITVTYRDGTVHTVFSGTLARDGSETITFPEGDSRIRAVEFACKAESRDGARIALSSVSDPGFPGSNDGDRRMPARLHTDAGLHSDADAAQ